MKSVILKVYQMQRNLTDDITTTPYIFLQFIFTTEIEIFLLHLYTGTNLSNDSILVTRSNNPFFVFSKLGSLKLSLDAWNLINFLFCKFLYASWFLSSHVQREFSKAKILTGLR